MLLAHVLPRTSNHREGVRPEAFDPKTAGQDHPCPDPETSFNDCLGEAADILAAQAGDLSAFNRLVTAYQDSLYGWVLSLVRDPILADDVTQTSFIAAYENLSIFRGGSLRAWLFTIARNRSFDELRRLKRRPSLSLDGSPEDGYDLLSILPGPALRPEEIYEASEQISLIERLMAQLPEAARQVLQLVDIEEMDYEEAAQVLGVPLGTLKSRLVRARLKLRELILRSE